MELVHSEGDTLCSGVGIVAGPGWEDRWELELLHVRLAVIRPEMTWLHDEVGLNKDNLDKNEAKDTGDEYEMW